MKNKFERKYTPELIHRNKLIEEILSDIRHLPTERCISILFAWMDMDTLERMHKVICKVSDYQNNESYGD